MARYTTQERDEARKFLKKALNRDRVIYQTVTSVARSGMYRTIKNCIVMRNKYTKKHQIICIDWYVARALDYTLKDGKGIGIGGCGMDMGFHLAYSLGRALWPKGDKRTVTGRNGDKNPETDGGYLIRQEWI